MNVLKPELIWIDNQCYRLLGNGEWSNSRVIPPYVEDNEKMDCSDSEEFQDAGIEIVPVGTATFKHKFSVAKSFFPHIVGSKHAVRKRLEAETGTRINLPKVGHDGDIEIFGCNCSGIIKARRRIDLLVEAAKKKMPPTHFLSIPLNEEQIRIKFNAFKEEVLTNSGRASRGVNDAIFQIPTRLHLTIEAITLFDDKDKKQAIDTLNYCKEHIVKPMIDKHGQFPIRLQGTEIMNDDPGEAKILYAKIVEESGVLQEMADSIANYYGSIGLVQRKRDQVKLHVTFMNSKFIKERSNVTFDASEILKIHENTDFGETTLKQIDICQRHTISSTGYYSTIAKMNLVKAP